MKIRLYVIYLLTLACLLIPSVTYASDTSNALYTGIITVTNNSTANTSVSTNISGLNTTDLQAHDWLNASANNSAIQKSGSDVAFMPGYGSIPWILWVDSIGELTSDGYTFYTDTVTGGKIRYFPGPTGMTTTDSASLELGDNFTIGHKGFFDTSASAVGANITSKEGAHRTWISGTGNVSSEITVVSFMTGDDNTDFIYGANWRSQSFTTVGAASVNYVHLELIRVGNPGTVTVNITASAAGLPSTNLASGTINGNSCDNVTAAWYDIPLTSSASLAAATMYHIAVQALTGDGANYINWRVDTGAGYAGGTACASANSGHVWATVPANDFMFSVGITITAPVSSGEHTINMGLSTPFMGMAIDGSLTLPVSANLVMNDPLYSSLCATSPFTSVDAVTNTNTVDGATWGTTGYTFDGINDKIVVNDSDRLDLCGNSTIIVWLNVTSLADIRTIADKGLAGTGGLRFRINMDGSMQYRTYQVAANQNTISAAGDITTGAWYHIAMTRTGPTVKLYKNGVDVTVTSGAHIDPTATALDLWLGENHDLGQFFAGTISEIRVYDDNLTPAQILQDYNSTKTHYSVSGDIYTTHTLATVPDNSNNWTDCQSAAMPYVEYKKVWVDGVLVQSIDWEYATIFQDASASNNDATPSFRTTSSDTDVSAALVSFTPVTLPIAPPYSVGEGPDFYTTNITITGNFTSSANATGRYPGQRLINDLARATGTPQQLPEVIIWSFVILAASITLSYWFKSVFIKMMILAAGMGMGIAVRDPVTGFGVYDWWMLIFFIIFGLAVIFASNERARA